MSNTCHELLDQRQTLFSGRNGRTELLYRTPVSTYPIDDMLYTLTISHHHSSFLQQSKRRLTDHTGINLTHMTQDHQRRGSLAYHLIGQLCIEQDLWIIVQQVQEVGHTTLPETSFLLLATDDYRTAFATQNLNQLFHSYEVFIGVKDRIFFAYFQILP